MTLNNTLARNIDAMGTPTKKQKLLNNTPLKHFLRPIIEEAMIQKMQMMQQTPEQVPQQPTGNPLQGALMNRGGM